MHYTVHLFTSPYSKIISVYPVLKAHKLLGKLFILFSQ